jgi:hypothetical protein
LKFTLLGAASPEDPGTFSTQVAALNRRRRLALVVAAATAVAGCETEAQRIPLITAEVASQLPASQLPRVFKDPDPLVHYPYNIHETDGLSRNPDDCVRWGCVDAGRW